MTAKKRHTQPLTAASLIRKTRQRSAGQRRSSTGDGPEGGAGRAARCAPWRRSRPATTQHRRPLRARDGLHDGQAKARCRCPGRRCSGRRRGCRRYRWAAGVRRRHRPVLAAASSAGAGALPRGAVATVEGRAVS